jgi:hypothetical protein
MDLDDLTGALRVEILRARQLLNDERAEFSTPNAVRAERATDQVQAAKLPSQILVSGVVAASNGGRGNQSETLRDRSDVLGLVQGVERQFVRAARVVQTYLADLNDTPADALRSFFRGLENDTSLFVDTPDDLAQVREGHRAWMGPMGTS